MTVAGGSVFCQFVNRDGCISLTQENAEHGVVSAVPLEVSSKYECAVHLARPGHGKRLRLYQWKNTELKTEYCAVSARSLRGWLHKSA
jgi:hypothetical protein